MFRFFLNNTLVSNPLNWADFSEILERDDDVRGILLKIDAELEFHNDGYKLLYDLKKASGYCNEVSLIITKSCGGNTYNKVFEGTIFISDVKFNLNKCSAQCGVEDTSYTAKIYNNKKIKAKLSVGISKNDTAITACPTTMVKFFTPSTGALITTERTCYDVYNAFEFLIAYMTDGQVDFISTWYNNLTRDLPDGSTEAFKLCVVTGEEIRTPSGTAVPEIDYQMLFDEINKKFNIGFLIEIQSNGRPRVRIENIDYLFSATSSGVVIDNVPDLIESFEVLHLYSRLAVGSDAAKYVAADHSLPPIRLLTFKEEQYTIQGVCNIDDELDLVSEWKIDHNIIEELVATNTTNDDYDEDIFLIEYTEHIGYNAATGLNIINPALSAPLYYNPELLNSAVIPRWNLQGDVAKYLGNGNDGFFATRTTTSAVLTPVNPSPLEFLISFEDDTTPPNENPNGNYDPILSRYTSLLTGIYSFRAVVNWRTESLIESYRAFRITAIRYDSSNNVLESKYVFGTFHYTPNPIAAGFDFQDTLNFTMLLENGDYIETYGAVTPQFPFVGAPISFRLLSGSTFQTTAIVNGGGIYSPNDPAIYNVSKFSFKYPISEPDWQAIKSAMERSITFGIGDGDKYGWVKRMERNMTTGMTDIELLSNLNNS